MHKLTKLNESSKIIKEDYTYDDYFSSYGHKNYTGGGKKRKWITPDFEQSLAYSFFKPWVANFDAGLLAVQETISLAVMIKDVIFGLRNKNLDKALESYKERSKKLNEKWKPILDENKEVYDRIGMDANIVFFGAAPQFFLAVKSVKKFFEVKGDIGKALAASGIPLKGIKKTGESEAKPEEDDFDEELKRALRILFYGKEAVGSPTQQSGRMGESKIYFLKEDKEEKKEKISDQELMTKIYEYLEEQGILEDLNKISDEQVNDFLEMAKKEKDFYITSKGKIETLKQRIDSNIKDQKEFINQFKNLFPEYNFSEFEKEFSQKIKEIEDDITKKYKSSEKENKPEKEIDQKTKNSIHEEAVSMVFSAQKNKIIEELENYKSKELKKPIEELLSSIGTKEQVEKYKDISPLLKKLYTTYKELESLISQ